jgi:glycosyltransferase involved in cell wall biosynthesis
MLRRLIFATQTIDADDPNLAQTVDIVRALAERSGEVAVLAHRVRRHDLPPNVTFRTFGAGTRGGRTARYVAGLAAATRRGRPDAVIAHMSTLFLLAAAPLAKPLRIPLVLWYTHWAAHPTLPLADRLASAVVSVDRASYPLKSDKLVPVGHAIDVDAFRPRDHAPDGEGLRLLALGKTDPWKGFPLLLDAVERLVVQGIDVHASIRGPHLSKAQQRHREELAARIASSPVLRERAELSDAVPRHQVPDLIRAADAVVNPARVNEGSEALDKVLFETAACSVPIVASHSALKDELSGLPVPLWFRPGDADDLTAVLARLAGASIAEREETGRRLRAWVEREHSLEHWADRMVEVVGALQRR